MRKYLYIVLLLALALSCRGPRLIPREKLEDIYMDMFIADQQIIHTSGLRSRADTMLVYEAVFNRYGYDTDDYLYTVETNLKDPERFSKMLQSVAERLEAEADVLQKEIDHLEWVSKYMGMKGTPLDSLLAPFSQDSVFLGQARLAPDSLSGALLRMVPVQEDTLMIPLPVDTLDHE